MAVAIVSISLNPLLYRLVDPAERWLARRPRLWRVLTARARRPVGPDTPPWVELDPRYRAVVVGYGPVGRTLCRLLRENGVEPTVVELNLETVQRLRAEGGRRCTGTLRDRRRSPRPGRPGRRRRWC